MGKKFIKVKNCESAGCNHRGGLYAITKKGRGTRKVCRKCLEQLVTFGGWQRSS